MILDKVQYLMCERSVSNSVFCNYSVKNKVFFFFLEMWLMNLKCVLAILKIVCWLPEGCWFPETHFPIRWSHSCFEERWVCCHSRLEPRQTRWRYLFVDFLPDHCLCAQTETMKFVRKTPVIKTKLHNGQSLTNLVCKE